MLTLGAALVKEMELGEDLLGLGVLVWAGLGSEGPEDCCRLFLDFFHTSPIHLRAAPGHPFSAPSPA